MLEYDFMRNAFAAGGIAAIVGLSLFYGDGMLTPAISVLSAVEGVGIGSPLLESLILPLSLIILVGLFLLQSGGTADARNKPGHDGFRD